MQQERTAKYKSKKFAVRIIKLYKYLCESHREYGIFKQLLRCGTSIGANIAEAECGISRKDFLAKIYIVPPSSTLHSPHSTLFKERLKRFDKGNN